MHFLSFCSAFETRLKLFYFLCFCCIKEILLWLSSQRWKRCNLVGNGGNKERETSSLHIFLHSGFKFGVITWVQHSHLPYYKEKQSSTISFSYLSFYMENQDMGLALSTDAKPRLKWTQPLHQRFVEAVNHLGGAERATPKGLMRVMGIQGLTLYHLKSHLQKYRLGKNQQSESCNGNEQEESDVEGCYTSEVVMDGTNACIDENLNIAHTLQMQMEVQNKLQEQIEVQRHLQLRIEAQGMYLQSILKKAQETLAGYNSMSSGLEAAKTEVQCSLVETGHLNSSMSGFTSTRYNVLDDARRRSIKGTDCSVDSALTFSESCDRRESKHPSMEINGSSGNVGVCNKSAGRKRSGSTISDESSVEQSLSTVSPSYQDKLCKMKKLGQSVAVRREIDLNISEPETLDES